ncbi:MAG TPA: VWA domain-containing protein [Bacteroidales bacterium]|nr:VWA domain-containing protein [Bacteroidales bacterium]
MNNLQFAHPEYLFLLLFILPAVIWYIYRHNRVQSDMQVSSLAPFRQIGGSARIYLRHLPFVFRLLAVALLIVVLARPQSTNRWENETIEGIDIMLALDISGSMLAGDFVPNRIEASKDVATEFVSGRPNDRIGLVLFGGESFTQCPLTTDHAVLINLLHEANVGIIGDQSTAIGLGLANAVKRLKDSNARSRVVILVTDGVNNAGSVDPLTAAEIARTFGIRVYTIGVGTRGTAPFPVHDIYGNIYYRQLPVEIDEEILGNISEMTNGNYFRATSNQKLKEIYTQIDRLEKSKIDVREFSRKHEEYRIFAIGALILVILDFLMRTILLKSVT